MGLMQQRGNQMSERKLPSWIEENLMAVAPDLRGTTLFKFKVRLQIVENQDSSGKPKYKEIEVDLLPDLDLDYEILEQQMLDCPAQYAFWAAVYSEVRMGVAIAERKLKMRHGAAMERVQQEFADRNLKPQLEVIKRIVEKDEGLARADMEYQRLQMQAGKLYHMLEALKAKIDVARSVVGFKRQEYNA